MRNKLKLLLCTICSITAVMNYGYSIENNKNNINHIYNISDTSNNDLIILDTLKDIILSSYDKIYYDENISSNNVIVQQVTGCNTATLSKLVQNEYYNQYNSSISRDYNISEKKDKLVDYRILAIIYKIIVDYHNSDQQLVNNNDFLNV